MMPLSRLLAGAAAAFAAIWVARDLAYPWQVLLAFLAAGLAAGAVRELWSIGPAKLRVYLGDMVTSLSLALIMLLAVRAFGHGHLPSPLLPALSWPFVDLWRPLRRG